MGASPSVQKNPPSRLNRADGSQGRLHRLAAPVVLIGLALCAPFLYLRTSRHSAAETHLYRGAEHLKQAQPSLAEQEWLAAKRLTPDNPNVYRALSELYRVEGRIAEARTARNRLADLVPGEPHVLCTFVESEIRNASQSEFENAVRDAVRAAALEPKCVRALTIAGDASMDAGDQKAGLEYLKHAVHLKPEDVPLTLHYINRLLEANDLAGAYFSARGLTARYPGYAQGYVLMAAAGSQYPPGTPEARATEGLLLKALRLDPTNALAHVRLGNLYLKTADFGRAVPHLEAGRLLHYDQVSLLFNLSEAYRRTGRTADADRLQHNFQQISRLENELSVLDRQLTAAPSDAGIEKRRSEIHAALDKAKQIFNEPTKSSATIKEELPAGMTGGETK